MVVILGFSTAGYLINKSYSDWQMSPTLTSITTHPISSLDFPTVTVCPPKDSHSALNYDLMKADNASLSYKNRNGLKKSVAQLFVYSPHEEYARNMIEATNLENIRQVFEGYQSIPTPYHGSGFEVQAWKSNGSWQTPGYQEDFDASSYKQSKQHCFVLQLPQNIADKIGSGFLEIEIEVDTREEEGWHESVTFLEGSKYKLYKEKKTWSEAEAHCRHEGSHLASVLREDEQKEVSLSSVSDLWIGGSDQEEEGIWKWTDKSVWDYTAWDVGAGQEEDVQNCLYTQGMVWNDASCDATRAFICQEYLKKVTGTVSFRYAKKDLSFDKVQLFYHYKFTNQSLLESWDNKRMTGFKVIWKIWKCSEDLEIFTEELGRNIQTPLLGEQLNENFLGIDHTFKSTLRFPENISELVGSGSLVIHLETRTREEGEYVKTNKGGPNQLKLYIEAKNWKDASDHCQTEGGQLASVLSAEEQMKVEKLTGDGTVVWIGASDEEEEGVWGWSDGSPWNYTNWKSGFGNRGKGKNCAEFAIPSTLFGRLKGSGWADVSCTILHSFICQFTSRIIRGHYNMTLELTKEQLTFSFFEATFKYEVSGKELLGSWQNDLVSGFRLSWYLKDRNGKSLTELLPDKSSDWKPAVTTVSRRRDPILTKTVQLALRARLSGLTKGEIIASVVREKANLVLSKKLNYKSMCSEGLVNVVNQTWLFGQISLGTQNVTPTIKGQVLDDDIVTGLMMLAAMVYCSESVALSQFLTELVSTQSPRTIIKASVNILQSGNIKKRMDREYMNNFYSSLDKIFNFQLGKIILAVSSPLEIKGLIALELPYLTKYLQEVNECLRKGDCQEVRNLVNSLGKISLQLDS